MTFDWLLTVKLCLEICVCLVRWVLWFICDMIGFRAFAVEHVVRLPRLRFMEFIGFIWNLIKVLDVGGGGVKDCFGGWVGLSLSRRGCFAALECKSVDIDYPMGYFYRHCRDFAVRLRVMCKRFLAANICWFLHCRLSCASPSVVCHIPMAFRPCWQHASISRGRSQTVDGTLSRWWFGTAMRNVLQTKATMMMFFL